MVQHPVAMTFAPDGRLWVVEMRGYMPDVDGTGEGKPNGRISVLEDIDGDGRMDKSTVFLDGLVLPRAIGLVRDGALVAVPPNLLFCRDTNGDGVSDQRRVIAEDYGIRGNPEHQANGLLYGLDNWIYSANYDPPHSLRRARTGSSTTTRTPGSGASRRTTGAGCSRTTTATTSARTSSRRTTRCATRTTAPAA